MMALPTESPRTGCNRPGAWPTPTKEALTWSRLTLQCPRTGCPQPECQGPSPGTSPMSPDRFRSIPSSTLCRRTVPGWFATAPCAGPTVRWRPSRFGSVWTDSRFTGVQPRIGIYVADAIAIRLGRHPSLIWHDWFSYADSEWDDISPATLGVAA